MSTYVVDEASDTVDGDYSAGHLSLREAVALADAGSGTATITFDASLAGQTIRLTNGEIASSTALSIDAQDLGITITGDANGDDATLTGSDITDLSSTSLASLADNSRIFDFTATSGTVSLNGLTLTGGHTPANAASGGAVYSASNLVITNSTIAGNSTGGSASYGGGVYAAGSVTLTNVSVVGNQTTGGGSYGGGIRADGSLTAINSTVTGNTASGNSAYGGGLTSHGSMTVTDSIVTGNRG